MLLHKDSCCSIHYHDEPEFILVIEGSIKVNIRNETYILKEDDFVLINANEVHSITSLSNNKFVSLKINTKVLTKHFLSYNDINFKCNSIFENDNNKYKYDKMRNLISNLLLVLLKKENVFVLKVCSYVYLIGEHLYNNFELIKIKSKYTEVRKDNRIDNIISYINKNYNTDITLNEVANEYNINYHFLSHYIKDNIGMSFQNYLNKFRLGKADSIIMHSNKNMTEIALANGFSSTSYFYKIFKKEYNCTPLEYRKKLSHISFDTKYYNIEGLSFESKEINDVIKKINEIKNPKGLLDIMGNKEKE